MPLATYTHEHIGGDTQMKTIATILILALGSLCWGESLPATPKPVEHDPGAWAITTGTVAVAGGIYKPWVGLAAGSAWAVFGNMQDQRAAHQNMVGGIAGSVAGYLIIKTLKKDWRKH